MNIERIKKHTLICFCLAFLAAVLLLGLNTGIMAGMGRNGYSSRIELNFKGDGGTQPQLQSQSMSQSMSQSQSQSQLQPQLQQTKGLTLKETVKIADAFPEGCVSYVNDEMTYASAGEWSYPVKASMTGHLYIDFLKISMIKGSYFTYDADKYGENVAVIGEELAAKLFSTYDVIGKSIYLFDNVKYEIVGLYGNKNSIASFLASDGMDKVFIPLESRSASTDTLVKTVLIKDDTLEHEKYRKHKVEAMLEEAGIDIYTYKINDFYDSYASLHRIQAIFVFAAAAYIVWILMISAKKRLRHRAAIFKEKLKEAYLREFVKRNMPALAAAMLESMGFLASAAVVFFTARFSLYVDNDCIPPDNVLDAGFYYEKIKASIHDMNLSLGYIPTQFEHEYGITGRIVTTLSLLLVLASIMSYSYLKLALMSGNRFASILKAALISIFFGIILYLPLQRILGLPFTIPFKESCIMLAFVLLYGQYAQRPKS